MEIIIFSGLVAGLKDSFHMLFFRLTNEAFFDIAISENCKLRGVIDGGRPLNSASYNLEFSTRKLHP